MFPITDTQHAVLRALCAVDNAFAKALWPHSRPHKAFLVDMFEDLQGWGLTMGLKR